MNGERSRSTRSAIRLLLVSIVLGALAGCGGGSEGELRPPDPAPVTASTRLPAPVSPTVPLPMQVVVTPSNANVAIGGTFGFSADVLPVNAFNAVTWTVAGPAGAADNCGAVG
jgi:hypothetical protein